MTGLEQRVRALRQRKPSSAVNKDPDPASREKVNAGMRLVDHLEKASLWEPTNGEPPHQTSPPNRTPTPPQPSASGLGQT